MNRDATWLAALGLAFAALYWATACPGVYWGDSAELVGAAVTLGIPHPPGYPLYTWLARAFVALPLEPARAVNLMSAMCGAASVVLCATNARALGASRLSSALAAANLGVGPWFWRQATIAEAYTPGALFLLGALRLALLGAQRRHTGWILLAAWVAGLGLGVHLALATTGLAFVGLALLSQRGASTLAAVRRGAPRLVLAGLCALAGAAVYLWLPYRARQGPALNFGNPRDWDSFLWVVQGGAYREWFGLPQGVVPRLLRIIHILGEHLTAPGLLLGAVGFVSLTQRHGAALASAWLLGVLGNVVFFFDYQVHDLVVFFLPAACLLAPLSALQLDVLLQACARRWPKHCKPRWLNAAVSCLVLGVLLARYPGQDRSEQREAEEYGQALVERLPENAIILHFTTPAEWKLACVFEWYFQLVKGARPDVRLLVLPYPLLVHELVTSGVPVFVFTDVQAVARLDTEPREAIATDLRQVIAVPPEVLAMSQWIGTPTPP
jgi:Protein of unknown function (DUF2723)